MPGSAIFVRVGERLRQGWSIEAALYAALVVVLLAPIWGNAYFLTQDGPMHLHNARMLLDQVTSPSSAGIYDKYYVPNHALFPYWFGHIALATLETVFPAEIAEKFFLSGYIVLFAWLARRVCRALHAGAGGLAYLALLLVYQSPFQMGFLSFCFSQVFLLAIIHSWVKNSDAPSLGWTLRLGAPYLALYFCHPVAYLFGVVCVWILNLFGCLGAEPGSRLRGLRSRSAALVLATAPSFLLVVEYFLTGPSYFRAPGETVSEVLWNFARQSGLSMVHGSEAWFGLVVAAIFLCLATAVAMSRIGSGRLRPVDGFLVCALAALAMNLYGSLKLIGYFDRMQTFPLIMLAFWFTGATSRWPSGGSSWRSPGWPWWR